jgi:hypothetical protein
VEPAPVEGERCCATFAVMGAHAPGCGTGKAKGP